VGWVPLPITVEQDEVTDRILQALRLRIPGWEPREGQLDVALVEEIGRELALLRALTVDVAAEAFAHAGRTLFGVAQLEGTRAQLDATLTLSSAGQTAPGGLTVVGRTADGFDVAFRLPAPATAVGTTVAVTLEAVEVGELANAVPVGPLQLVQTSLVVVSAQAISVSSGGTDPESTLAYLSRLTDTLSTLHQGFVLAGDAAILARSVAGVHRALGLDGYDPVAGTDGNPRTVTVVPVDVDGQPVPAAVASEVVELLEQRRELNFLVFTDAPTYTPVNVAFTAVAETGADPVTVQAEMHAAGLAFLDPATWGNDGDTDSPTWRPLATVRYLDLARALGSVPGVAYLTSLTINGTAGDLTLPGRAPLPSPATGMTPSTVSGTVT
jgi:hypothetical protein